MLPWSTTIIATWKSVDARSQSTIISKDRKNRRISRSLYFYCHVLSYFIFRPLHILFVFAAFGSFSKLSGFNRCGLDQPNPWPLRRKEFPTTLVIKLFPPSCTRYTKTLARLTVTFSFCSSCHSVPQARVANSQLFLQPWKPGSSKWFRRKSIKRHEQFPCHTEWKPSGVDFPELIDVFFVSRVRTVISSVSLLSLCNASDRTASEFWIKEYFWSAWRCGKLLK